MSKKKAKAVKCLETGIVFCSTMRLSHVLSVYETSVLRHLNEDTPDLLGRKYVYVEQWLATP